MKCHFYLRARLKVKREPRILVYFCCHSNLWIVFNFVYDILDCFNSDHYKECIATVGNIYSNATCYNETFAHSLDIYNSTAKGDRVSRKFNNNINDIAQ